MLGHIRIDRRREVIARTGLSNTSLHRKIHAGIFTRPISLSARAVGWPSYEVDQILAAMIAGRSDDDLRALVKQLEAARLPTGTAAEVGAAS